MSGVIPIERDFLQIANANSLQEKTVFLNRKICSSRKAQKIAHPQN